MQFKSSFNILIFRVLQACMQFKYTDPGEYNDSFDINQHFYICNQNL